MRLCIFLAICHNCALTVKVRTLIVLLEAVRESPSITKSLVQVLVTIPATRAIICKVGVELANFLKRIATLCDSQQFALQIFRTTDFVISRSAPFWCANHRDCLTIRTTERIVVT